MVELRDRELYRLFDRSPIGMYRCDQQGRFHYVNPALVRLLGYDSTDELLARNLDRDVYVDAAERARLIARYRPEGAVDGARVTWRTKQGQILIVKLYGHCLEEPGGPWFDASVLDVTEAETATAELRRQREVLETTASTLDLVVRQMPAIYWIVDRELRLQKTGGATREVLGFTTERLHGMTLDALRDLEPSDIDPVVMHQRALAGETITYPQVFRGKHLVTTVCPHRIDDAIVGALGTCIDLTSHYMLERHMVDAQRAESLGVLAGGLAHDFNNLLVAILGNADHALRDLPGGPARAPLENIRQASLRAAELTDQLLAYAGRGQVAATRVALTPLVDELVRITAPTMPDQVGVRLDLGRDLVLRGDASQIRQVLLNLLNNARDALGERGGTIAVTGRLVRSDGAPHPDDVLAAPAGTYVALDLADDGPGMDRATRRRVFEPFFTTKPTGHGLGLAAVLGIVRAHGGGLRLATAPGEGTRFSVLWPSTFTPEAIGAVAPPAVGQTVLVIDDEDLVRDVVARMIEDLGYAAITATDGAAGLAIVDHVPVDAVLVDLTMPRMSGDEVVSQLRQRRPDLPIVLCSGLGAPLRTVRADAYLPKPFRIDSLDQTLAKVLMRQ
jgi:PAS domain S-box-containing protein